MILMKAHQFVRFLVVACAAAASAATAEPMNNNNHNVQTSSSLTRTLVENWTRRPLMTSPQGVVGKYVRIDPLNLEQDVPLLWEALGGAHGTINERLQWWGTWHKLPDLAQQENLSEFLQSIDNRDKGSCVNIIRLVNNNNKVAGMTAYVMTRPEHGCTELGYIAHGDDMAQSPASTEAHYLLAKHVFETMGYRRYEWKCDSNHSPSGNAAMRYGFTFEGKFRQHVVTPDGYNRDTHWHSMIDSEWPRIKAALEAWLEDDNFDEHGHQKKRLFEFQTWRHHDGTTNDNTVS